MTLDEGAEAHQGNAVLAVQRASDFVEDGVEHAIRLLFGEVSLLRDGGCEFGFAHKCLFDGLLFLFPVLFNPEQRPRRRNSSALRQTAGEWHAARADASLRPANFHPFAVENAVPARIKAKAPATRGSTSGVRPRRRRSAHNPAGGRLGHGTPPASPARPR